MQHEFFQPKLGTGTKSSLLNTTADSHPKSQSRVESLIIGASSLQMKTKVLESPSFQS